MQTELKILIQNGSDMPLYQQIEEQVKDAIFTGALNAGDAMPSIRGFASDLKVSVLTIRRVYDDLEAQGFLVSQMGVGTFVAAGNLDILLDAKRRQVEQQMADMIQSAKALQISKQELMDMMDILYEEA